MALLMAVLNEPRRARPMLYDTALTSSRRDLTRAMAVAIAWLTDNALLIAASYTGALLRFGNLSDGNAPRLLIAVLPAFLLAALSVRCYNLQLLRHPFRSARQTLFACTIAYAVLFMIAFALQVGALFSRLEIGIIIVTSGI